MDEIEQNLRADLRVMLDTARTDCAAALVQLGRPTSITNFEWELIEEHGHALGATKEKPVSPYASLPSYRQSELYEFANAPDVTRVARQLLQHVGEDRIPSTFKRGLAPKASVAAIRATLREAIARYLRELGDLSQPNPTLADAIAAEILHLITGGSITRRIRVLLSGVQVEQELTRGRYTLRPVRTDDLGDLRQEGRGGVGDPVMVALSYPWFDSAAAILQSDTLYAQGSTPPQIEELLTVVWGLQLYAPLGGPGRVRVDDHPALYRPGGVHLPPLKLAPEPPYPGCTVSEEMWADVISISTAIPRDLLKNPRDQNLALKRFFDACTRDATADAIIDLAVVMEALALPPGDGGTSELRFRTALNMAWYLGTTPLEREGVFKHSRALYDLRSTLVHGQRGRNAVRIEDEQLKVSYVRSRALISAALRKALVSGWPTASLLQRLRLGYEEL